MRTREATVALAIFFLVSAFAAATQDKPQIKPEPQTKPETLVREWSAPINARGVPHLTAGAAAVFFSNDGDELTALAKAEGRILWSAAAPRSTMSAVGAGFVAALSPSTIHGLEQATGIERWRVVLGSQLVRERRWSWSTETRSFFATSDAFVLVAGTQVRSWGFDGRPRWSATLASRAERSAVEHGSALVLATSAPSLVALDTRAGTLLWEIRLPYVASAMASAGDRLLVTGKDGNLYCYEPPKAGQKWRFKLVPSVGAPAVAGKRVYLSLLDNSIQAFDVSSGSRQWSNLLAARPASGVAILGERAVVVLTSGDVLAMSLRTHAVEPASAVKAALGDRLQTFATDTASHRLFTAVISLNGSRTLSAWRVAAKTPERP